MMILSGCGTKLPAIVIDEPTPEPVRASCLYTPPPLSTIDPERWQSMTEVERARAVLRMHSRDSEAYRELVANYLDCSR